MAVRDIASHLIVNQILNEAITTDTNTDSIIIDTADYECGLMFAVGASAYTDGDYAVSILESTDSGMSGATTVPLKKLNGGGTAFPTVSAVIAATGEMEKFGIFSNLRYVQMRITSTSTTTGATLVAQAIQAGEVLPTE